MGGRGDYVEGFITGVVLTVMAMIGMMVFAKIVGEAWDAFMLLLAQRGFPQPATEYFLGLCIFILAVYAGAIKLKKVRKLG